MSSLAVEAKVRSRRVASAMLVRAPGGVGGLGGRWGWGGGGVRRRGGMGG